MRALLAVKPSLLTMPDTHPPIFCTMRFWAQPTAFWYSQTAFWISQERISPRRLRASPAATSVLPISLIVSENTCIRFGFFD